MLPLSPAFFAFAAGAVVLYWVCCRSTAARLAVLLLANFYFLARFAWFYPLLLLAAASIDFLVGLGLQNAPRGESDTAPEAHRPLVSRRKDRSSPEVLRSPGSGFAPTSRHDNGLELLSANPANPPAA